MGQRVSILLGAMFTAACSADGRVVATAFAEERTLRGDTLVVAHVAGQRWAADGVLEEVLRIGRTDGADEYTFGRIIAVAARGEGPVFVYDDYFQRLRMYGADGAFVREVGRRGSGPGEYRHIIGLGMLGDGSVAGWDASGRRVNVFTATGDRAQEFVIPLGSGFAPKPFGVDTASSFYILSWFGGRIYMLHANRDGVVTDTLPYPRGQPFAGTDGVDARLEVALHPYGYFVWGVSDRYVVHAKTAAGQRLQIERRIEASQNSPDTRPMFVDIQVGRDGTIWVLRRASPSEYDVFAPDGAFLGRVPVPDGISLHVIDGPNIWGIARDADGVQFIVRYRLNTSR